MVDGSERSQSMHDQPRCQSGKPTIGGEGRNRSQRLRSPHIMGRGRARACTAINWAGAVMPTMCGWCVIAAGELSRIPEIA